jgi:hypothetical protein
MSRAEGFSCESLLVREQQTGGKLSRTLEPT